MSLSILCSPTSASKLKNQEKKCSKNKGGVIQSLIFIESGKKPNKKHINRVRRKKPEFRMRVGKFCCRMMATASSSPVKVVLESESVARARHALSELKAKLGDDVEQHLRSLLEEKQLSKSLQATASMVLYHFHRESGAIDHAILSLTQAKVALEEHHGPSSLEYALVVGEQGMAEASRGRHDDASSLLLHGASVAEKAGDKDASVRMRHWAACSLAAAGRTEEACRVLKNVLNDRKNNNSVDEAAALASVGAAEVLAGRKDGGAEMLQDAMHRLHESVGHAHPLAHKTQSMWATLDLCDWTNPEHRRRLISTVRTLV